MLASGGTVDVASETVGVDDTDSAAVVVEEDVDVVADAVNEDMEE